MITEKCCNTVIFIYTHLAQHFIDKSQLHGPYGRCAMDEIKSSRSIEGCSMGWIFLFEHTSFDNPDT